MRVKTIVPSKHRKKRLLKRASGFNQARRIYRKAKETLLKSGQKAYEGRKQRKRNFRRLWITRLSAAVKTHGLNYSQFLDKLKKSKIELNRKLLSEIAISDTKSFNEIIKKIKSK